MQPLAAQPMQQGKCVESRLGYTAFGDQAVAAVERSLHDALLFKDVGKRPVGHGIDQPIAQPDIVGEPGPHERRVRDGDLILVRGVVFGPVNRKIRHGGVLHLVVDFADGAADQIAPRYRFVRSENILGAVIGVHVRRDKIERNVVPGGVRDHRIHPGGLRGSRSADAQTRIRPFDGSGRVIVQLKISSLLRLAGPEVDIRLVPDFEIPLAHLGRAVAFD